MKRLYDLANLTLLLLMGVFLARNFSRLPARLPMHFDAAGRPDRWDGRGGLIVMFIVPLVMTALFYLIIRLTPKLARNAQYVNIPRRAEVLALPEEKREAYWALIKEFFAGLAASSNLLFFLLGRGAVQVALGTRSVLGLKAVLPPLGLMIVVVVYYTWRMMTLPGKLIRGEA